MRINNGASHVLAFFFYAVIIGTLVACQRGATNTLLEPTTAPIPKAPSTPPEGAFWIDPTQELGAGNMEVMAPSNFKNGDAIHLAAYSVTLYILK